MLNPYPQLFTPLRPDEIIWSHLAENKSVTKTKQPLEM